MTPPLIEWSAAGRSFGDHADSGDGYLVKLTPGRVLVAVVDGLGHGSEAAAACRHAISVLKGWAQDSLVSLLKRCHAELRSTRGVVLSLASFNALDATMTWLGVGNVEGLLLRADPEATPAEEPLLLRGGVVGHQLPPPYASIRTVAPGDTLILATDGISNDFAKGLDPRVAPHQLAASILAGHGKETDDSLVVVARYLGATA